MHSHFSTDSRAPIWAMCLSAQQKGLTEICFTEHIDPGLLQDHPDWFLCDVPAYTRALDRIRPCFPSLSIRRGLELADAEHCHDVIRRHIAEDGLDFVLLSRHMVDGVDPYAGAAFFDGRTRDENYRRYLEAVLRSVKAIEDFDALAHIGYVTTYSPYAGEDKPHRLSDAPEVLDEIFRQLIERGKALEVNTGKWALTGQALPSTALLKRYRELGGELISLGSDAHKPEVIANQFRAAEEMLLGIGLRRVATFCQRRMRVYELGR